MALAAGAVRGLVAASLVGLWRRFVALVVDTALVGLISWPLSALYGDAQLALRALVTWLGYYAAMEWLFGATLGKRCVGLRVVSVGGKRAPWSRIAVRNLFRVIDALPFAYLVGGLSVLVTEREQRVGDRWAGTVVVPVQEAPPLTHLGRRVAALAVLVALVVGGSLAYDYYARPAAVVRGWAASGGAPPVVRVERVDVGVPAYSGDLVTFPVTYRDGRLQACTGTVSLRWYGFFTGGWQVAGAITRC